MDNVEHLIRDLSARLSDLAGEFGTRADRMITSVSLGAAQVDPSEDARRIIARRKARRRYFPGDLFHEPAWDMLLALFVVYASGRPMNVKALVGCSDAPATTSQRWIDHLHKSGLIDRVTDTIDRRRMEISLSPEGYSAMARYLAEVAAIA